MFEIRILVDCGVSGRSSCSWVTRQYKMVMRQWWWYGSLNGSSSSSLPSSSGRDVMWEKTKDCCIIRSIIVYSLDVRTRRDSCREKEKGNHYLSRDCNARVEIRDTHEIPLLGSLFSSRDLCFEAGIKSWTDTRQKEVYTWLPLLLLHHPCLVCKLCFPSSSVRYAIN